MSILIAPSYSCKVNDLCFEFRISKKNILEEFSITKSDDNGFDTSILENYESNTIYLLIFIALLICLCLYFFKKFNFKTFDYDFKEWSEIRCIFASLIIIFVIIVFTFIVVLWH